MSNTKEEIKKIVDIFNKNDITKKMLYQWSVSIAKIDFILNEKNNLNEEEKFEINKICEERIKKVLNKFNELPKEIQLGNEAVNENKKAINLLSEQLVSIEEQINKIYDGLLHSKKIEFLAQHRTMQNIAKISNAEIEKKGEELEIKVDINENLLKEIGIKIINNTNLNINSWKSDFKKLDVEIKEDKPILTPTNFLILISTFILITIIVSYLI